MPIPKPEIVYVSGHDLCTLDESWYTQVEVITRAEAHLLTKTRDDLEPTVLDNRVIIALDRSSPPFSRGEKRGVSNRVIGCIVLWELAEDSQGAMWYELGTFLVIPEYRFATSGLPIGDELYSRLLATHQDKNILGTTTNHKAIKTGRRHNMQMIRFGQLPDAVRIASCICPADKTGVDGPVHCRIKDQLCKVRVTRETWIRMGQPERLAYAA